MKKLKSAFSLIEISVVILIIGILISGVSQSGKMMQKFRLSTAVTLTKSSPVAGIKNLVVWWEATSEESFLNSERENNQKVSTWYDVNPRSIEKYNAVQATSGSQPAYVAEAINNLPALKFDGSATYLKVPYSANLNPTDLTIFVVVKTLGTTSHGAIISSRSATPVDPANQGYIIYATPASTYQTWVGNPTWGGVGTPSATIVLNKTNVLSTTAGNSLVNLYNNGATVSGSPFSQTMAVNSNPSRELRIGAGKNEDLVPQYFYNGYIGELIIFDRVLLNEERKAIEAYLGKKWGVKIS
ncbi:MAG: LamG domain-containing protein [Rickettsiales bacterium]|nr:LamG domain-containing protein [Rickettsiales bacterium]